MIGTLTPPRSGSGLGPWDTLSNPRTKQLFHRKLSRKPPRFLSAEATPFVCLRLLRIFHISGDSDDVFYDSKRHRIYAICGAGKIDIIEQTDPKTYKALTKVDTANGARTGLFVPERDTLFVAVPHRGPQQAEIRSYQVE